MEDPPKQDNHVKKHLSKLHERIQSKYWEMQKKLEKSKSIDSFPSLSDDLNQADFMYSSMDDVKESDEVFLRESELKTETITVENVNKQKAVYQHVELSEPRYAEIEDIRDEHWDRSFANSFDPRNSISLEFINDVGNESDDAFRPIPAPRTIRERINSKILAAKERRREEKEKQNKDKMKEKIEKLVLSNKKQDVSRKSKQATVTVALIEISGLEDTGEGKERLLNCKYRLGPEKGSSKVIKSGASVVKWQELFNIFMFEEHMLEFSCFDKTSLIGRHILDLSSLETEKTHKLRLDLTGGETSGAKIFILLTISGTTLANTVFGTDEMQLNKKNLKKANTIHDVGWLTVIIYGAKGLNAQDCYCVLKLPNERLQTHTEYKTNDPNWMKVFKFQLTDITLILEVTVIEEKKYEEVGKISIPLLRIKNGEKVWYALKDTTYRERAKGNNPRILLEMKTSWSFWKASIRVINRKEVDFLQEDQKFDRHVFARNLTRTKAIIKWTVDTLKVVNMCFEWESIKQNFLALLIWIFVCYFFKIWMFPLLLLIPFVRYRPKEYYISNWYKGKHKNSTEIATVKSEKEDHKFNWRQKINSLQEMVQSVQNILGKFANIGESLKNLVNFTVPFVSLLAIALILFIAFIMFIVPINYVFIIWGIHKFTRKILRPNRIPNNEILDLLSRVPDDETLLDCEELPLELDSDEDDIK